MNPCGAERDQRSATWSGGMTPMHMYMVQLQSKYPTRTWCSTEEVPVYWNQELGPDRLG